MTCSLSSGRCKGQYMELVCFVSFNANVKSANAALYKTSFGLVCSISTETLDGKGGCNVVKSLNGWDPGLSKCREIEIQQRT